MFERNYPGDNRGQVGIGTLIVFIAMVLVAAIAAGVLINTAGSLQSQASDTGTETQQAVANQIEVVHAYGVIEDPTDSNADTIGDLRLVVKKSAGSDVIDINSLDVQFTSDDVSRTLTYDNTPIEADPFAETSTPYDGFRTKGLAGTNGGGEALTDTSDRIEISIMLEAASDTPEAGQNEAFNTDARLDESDSATINLVDQSGAKFSYGVTAPATFGSDTVVEV